MTKEHKQSIVAIRCIKRVGIMFHSHSNPFQEIMCIHVLERKKIIKYLQSKAMSKISWYYGLVERKMFVFIYVTDLIRNSFNRQLLNQSRSERGQLFRAFKTSGKIFFKQSQIHQQNRCFPLWQQNTTFLYVFHMVQIHFRNKIPPLKGSWEQSALLDSANKSLAKASQVFESQNFTIIF